MITFSKIYFSSKFLHLIRIVSNEGQYELEGSTVLGFFRRNKEKQE